jgi:hypothetical protein
MDLLIVLILIVVLDIAALAWGVDSRDDINSLEWERRLQWGHAL